jgi:HSP20 family protein
MFNYLTNFDGGLFDEFRRLEREMDQLFTAGPTPSGIRSVARGTYPPINIGTTDEQVDVYLFAPALDLENLDISIQHNLLTIKGARKASEVVEGTKFYRKECVSGEFQRVITLPDDVDQGQVDASYRDGVLQITIQRKATSKPRQITVN